MPFCLPCLFLQQHYGSACSVTRQATMPFSFVCAHGRPTMIMGMGGFVFSFSMSKSQCSSVREYVQPMHGDLMCLMMDKGEESEQEEASGQWE